ncbi:MAG: hypothetical protein NT007_04715 [Candidatus Kapabacteria bacterium]|nr:hypothetical protein [Candidatus Kapabacteria bacterium]
MKSFFANSLRIYLILIIIIFAYNNAKSQCCAAGNPVNSNCSPTTGFNRIFDISWNQAYSLSNTYFDGTRKLDKQYADINFNFSSLALSYGISEKLKLTFDIGFFINKSQHFKQNIISGDTIPDFTKKAQGIADGSIGLVFQTYRSEDKLFNFMQSLRITLPLGAFNQEDANGNVLPIDLQPSSGNYKVNLGFIFSKKFENSDFSIMSANNIEFSQMIETQNSYQKYGNLYNLSLAGVYQINPNVLSILQVRCEIRDKALNGAKSQGNSYSFLNSSGGQIYFVSPQVSYRLADSWMLSCQFNQPIIKHVYGEQLTNKYSVLATISKSFDFSVKDDVKISESHDSTEKFLMISVKGNCDMCKARIEYVANDSKFVESSEWNSESKALKVYYKNGLPDVDAIKKSIAAAGHDTELYKAPDDVYEKLPKCCHYREK